MDDIGKAIVVIVSSIIGLAILSVIVSRNSNTSGVIQSAGTGLSQIIGAAVGPVTGSTHPFGSTSAFSNGANGYF